MGKSEGAMDANEYRDRRAEDARLRSIEARLDAGARRMNAMQTELTANTAVTTEMRDILDAVRSGLQVLGALGKLAVWIGKLAAAGAAVSALWYAITHGGQAPGR